MTATKHGRARAAWPEMTLTIARAPSCFCPRKGGRTRFDGISNENGSICAWLMSNRAPSNINQWVEKKKTRHARDWYNLTRGWEAEDKNGTVRAFCESDSVLKSAAGSMAFFSLRLRCTRERSGRLRSWLSSLFVIVCEIMRTRIAAIWRDASVLEKYCLILSRRWSSCL